MSNPSIDDLRDLSDEDVKLLYDIVTAAETSQAPPFRALFTAYEQVLAKRGISKDHDQLYLRFLLRMGEGRKAGRGLYDQFESLLDRLGFQVAFDDEDEDEDEDDEKESNDEDPLANPDPSASPPRVNLLQTKPFRPARRASFDIALDNSSDSKPLAALPVRPRSTNGSRPAAQHVQRTNNPAPEHSNVQVDSRDRLELLNQRSRPAPAAKPFVAAAKLVEEPHESDETLAEDSESISEHSGSEVTNEIPQPQVSGVAATGPADNRPMPPPENIDARKRQLETNAKTLKYHHIAARAVLFFRDWCDSAKQSRKSHEQMFNTALHHDANILKHQAFDQWCLELYGKRQTRETERFFDNLETRAGKARDLFLLTKSFTHWAQCASEETMRKSAARKLILQTRYFNAWRDVTVVNELKSRRQRLSKFLSIWIRRTETVLDQQDEAVDFNTARSIHYAYRQWFWNFCERRTPSWHMSQRKDGIFKKWVQMTREALIRRSWAVDFRDLELQRSCVVLWTQRSSLVQQHQHDAAIFRRRALLAPTVETLWRETQLAPFQFQVSRATDVRVARAALFIWRRKARDVVRASKTNELRVMRNAWTQWNDFLRCQALSRVIDDRLVIQTLYKWVLAERSVICEKAKAEDLQKNLLSRWHAKMSELSASLGHAKYAVSISQQNRAASSALTTWLSLAQAERQQTACAEKFRRKRLISGILNSWAARTRQVTQLDKWASDARFFVLVSRSCKTWRTATVTTKRNKRRDVFVAFRTKTASARARRILDKWRDGVQAKTQLMDQGREMEQRHFVAVGTSLFDSWRERLSRTELHTEQADIFWTERTVLRNFQRLISSLRQIKEYEARASELHDGIVDATAASSLRKLNWKAFQLKRQHESADSLLHRNQRKHHRHMLRYWATSTMHRRQMRQSSVQDEQRGPPVHNSVPANRTLGPGQTPFMDREPRRNESQTMPRLATMRHPQSLAATPGYLRTPSRRATAGKIKAHAVAATQPLPLGPQSQAPTTPSATRITPFMNRLRANYQTGNLALDSRSTRRDFALQQGVYEASAVEFDDIPESPALEFRESGSRHEEG